MGQFGKIERNAPINTIIIIIIIIIIIYVSVCAFPYVMAFTPDTIEIRLIINGNLVHTTTMPDLTLITSKVRPPCLT